MEVIAQADAALAPEAGESFAQGPLRDVSLCCEELGRKATVSRVLHCDRLHHLALLDPPSPSAPLPTGGPG